MPKVDEDRLFRQVFEVDPEILQQVQEFTARVRQLNLNAREAANALRISHGEVSFIKLEIFETGYYEYVSKPDRVGPVAPEFEVKEGHTWLMLRDGHSPLLMLYRDGEWRVKEHEDNMVKEAKAIAESSRMSFKQALELVRSGQEYVIDLDGTVLIIVEAEN